MALRLSIVIPTHRRVDALEQLLGSIAAQTLPREEFEVFVVDDGSPEAEHAVLLEIARNRFADMPLTLWRQGRGGPARARNDAIARAQAPIVLILNDDVTLAPDHFEAHLRAHAEAPEEHVVFRGQTVWAENSPDTPVMRWMRANTFRYDWDYFHPVEAHFVNFHTCDLSAKRSLLREFPFDEGYPLPSMEDTDLALRLLKAGRLDLRLLPEARSVHHHPHDLAAFERRARMEGKAMALLLDRHPELEYRAHWGYLLLVPLWRRRWRALRSRLLGRDQAWLQELHDVLMLEELNRARGRPPADWGHPYPQRLLDALPPGSPALSVDRSTARA